MHGLQSAALSLLILLCGCSAPLGPGRGGAPEAGAIELVVTEVAPEHHRVEVDVRLGARVERFLLDTGAPKTTLRASAASARYPVVGPSARSAGVSGQAASCERVEIDEIALGPLRAARFPAKRCDAGRNLLGLDFFAGRTFRIDLVARQLTLAGHASTAETTSPPPGSASLARLEHGHVTLPCRVGDVEANVLFDTGADTTVVDAAFVARHPSLFAKKRSEEGRDANGVAVPSEVYAVRSFQVGELRLDGVEVAAFDFTPEMRRAMGARTPIILGTNAIVRGVWTFDLARGHWSVQQR